MKVHRTDLVSLAFGLLFLGVAAWWLVAQILGLVLPPVGWFLAGALLVVGVLGLIGALRSARARPDSPSDGPPAGTVNARPGQAASAPDEPVAAVTDHDYPADEAPIAVTDRDDAGSAPVSDRAEAWPSTSTDRAEAWPSTSTDRAEAWPTAATDPANEGDRRPG